MLVLVIERVTFPQSSKNYLCVPADQVPGKIQQVICTGNVCDKLSYDYLRSLANENPRLPFSLLVHYPPVRIGVVHGHQVVPQGDPMALSALARSMDADILISGHTHQFEAFRKDGRFFLNPGSATGAWSADQPLDFKAAETVLETIPSFARAFLLTVLDVQGAVVVIYVYQLLDGDVKVEKLEYRKGANDSRV